jgi:hypothetical protein
MLSLELAQRLLAAGLPWQPRSGDRFVIPVPDLTEQVFVLSEMVADVHRFGGGEVIGFNGTTEWALDSIARDAVVWLPLEGQLRDALGEHFVALDRGETGYTVTYFVDGRSHRTTDPDVEQAYGLALLAVLQRPAGPAPA